MSDYWLIPALAGLLQPRSSDVPGRRSSFYYPMLMLTPARRRALFALYDFCHQVDDIVDDPHGTPHAMATLNFWRHEIMAMDQHPTTQREFKPLFHAIQQFHLTRSYLLDILSGFEMDAQTPMIAPPMQELGLYCYRVASAVGLLACEIFGCTHPLSKQFAIHLGHGLQLINILRDIEKDAALGRLYLPAELLSRHGLAGLTPHTIHQAGAQLIPVCQEMAAMAQKHFVMATASITRVDRRRLIPALMMRDIYRKQLLLLEQEGWHIGTRTIPSVSHREQLWMALRGLRYFI